MSSQIHDQASQIHDQASQTHDQASQPNSKALEIAFEAVKSEYDGEQERIGTFEGRTGILLTLASALLAFEGQYFVIPKRSVSYATAGLIVALQLISIIVLIGAMYCLIQVISTKIFHRINHDALQGQFYYYKDVDAFGTVIHAYRESIRKTAEVIEKRARWFTAGLWLLFAGLVLVTIARIVTLYVGG